MKFKPLYDLIAIEQDKADEKSEGGIITGVKPADKPSRGNVVAIGQGRYNDITGLLDPLTVQVDDVVMFAKGCGQEIEIDKKTYLIMTERELLGILG